jgi:hypothetical protein
MMNVGVIAESRYNPGRYGSTLSHWFDAANPVSTGVLPSDGAIISNWYDRSGNTSATGTSGPTFKRAIKNGLPVMRFNGSSQMLSSTLVSGLPATITVIVKTNSTAINQTCVYNGNTSSSGYGLYFDTNRNVLCGSVISKADGASTLNYEVLTWQWTGTTHILRLNGVQQTLANATSVPNSPAGSLFIGASTSTGPEWFNGDIGEIIYRNAAVSTTIIQYDERYIGRKWGVTVA